MIKIITGLGEKLRMAGTIRKIGMLLVLAVVLALGALLTAFSYTDTGVTTRVHSRGGTPSANLSEVPQEVADDAVRLAGELFGDYGRNYENFVSQLLGTYLEARDKDVVMFFNSGGWGWNQLEASPGWSSIFNGIEGELTDLGYTTLLLDYQRTELTARGIIDEFVELMRVYPSKSEALAYRVEFLTRHIQDVKIIVTGESDGTVITDSVMNILRDNQRVYSIQTGPPFWHQTMVKDRTLVMDDNGLYPDTFTRGEVATMIWTSLQEAAGVPQPPENTGRVLFFLRAPGHDYQWEYPEVNSQISDFLKTNLGHNQG
jgi:hypothetical protein